MIIDVHTHIGTSHGPFQQTAAELVDAMEKNGVDKAVTFTYPQKIDNDYIAQMQREYSDRLIGWALIDPWMDNSGETIHVKHA